MALNTFGWTPAEVTTDSAGNAIAGAELTVWTDLERTTPIQFAYDRDGTTMLPTKTVYAKGDTSTALTSAVLTSGAKGRFGFLADETHSLVYVWDGSTDDPWPVAAHEALDSGSATHAQAVADAQAAADSAAASASLVGAPADNVMATTLGNAASQSRAALDGAYETGAAKVICVSPTGNDSRNGKTWGTAKATIAAAVTALAGAPGTILLDHGVHEVGNGLSLSGAKCSLIGRGAGMTGSTADRTVIKASTQTGPVLDLTGYSWPANFKGRVEFGKFAVVGSGAADATKNNAGIRVGTAAAPFGSTYFHDIAISGTGGPALELGAVYLCDFDRITLCTPVSAQANDVPYLYAIGANGNRFNGVGLRSTLTVADVGVSGAVVMVPGGGYAPHDNVFYGMWLENLHIPTNGCLISIAGNANIIDAPEFFDCAKETGATGTAVARFLVPSGAGVVNFGGNMWRGYVPGKGTSATSFDLGIDVQQSRNAIIGPKGYRGTNIQLASGVGNTYILLAGAESTATDAAVVDNSGVSTNVYIDTYLRSSRQGEYAQDFRNVSAGAAGPRFYDPGTVGNGTVYLGQSDTRVSSVGTDGYMTANAWIMRSIDLAKSMRFDVNSAAGIKFPDHGTLPTATASLRGKIVVVQGATGVADVVYVCRKNAADAYEWAPLS